MEMQGCIPENCNLGSKGSPKGTSSAEKLTIVLGSVGAQQAGTGTAAL